MCSTGITLFVVVQITHKYFFMNQPEMCSSFTCQEANSHLHNSTSCCVLAAIYSLVLSKSAVVQRPPIRLPSPPSAGHPQEAYGEGPAGAAHADRRAL